MVASRQLAEVYGKSCHRPRQCLLCGDPTSRRLFVQSRSYFVLRQLQTLADASFLQGHDDDAYKILQDWTAEFPNNGKPYLMMAAIDALHARDAAAAANLTRHHQMLPLSTIS
jgi:hypothetical protein